MAEILESDVTDGIICDIGMPVFFQDAVFNCRILCLNRKILYIRPKMLLADEGNYRETRFFAIWQKDNEMQEFLLPKSLHHIQKTTLFGIGLLQTNDTIIG